MTGESDCIAELRLAEAVAVLGRLNERVDVVVVITVRVRAAIVERAQPVIVSAHVEVRRIVGVAP